MRFSKEYCSAVVYELSQRLIAGEVVETEELQHHLKTVDTLLNVRRLSGKKIRKVSKKSVEHLIHYLKRHGFLPSDITPIFLIKPRSWY